MELNIFDQKLQFHLLAPDHLSDQYDSELPWKQDIYEKNQFISRACGWCVCGGV